MCLVHSFYITFMMKYVLRYLVDSTLLYLGYDFTCGNVKGGSSVAIWTSLNHILYLHFHFVINVINEWMNHLWWGKQFISEKGLYRIEISLNLFFAFIFILLYICLWVCILWSIVSDSWKLTGQFSAVF